MRVFKFLTSKDGTPLTKVWFLLVVSQIALIVTTFFPLVNFSMFGPMNLYGLESVSTYLLVLSLVEVFMTLRQKQLVFLPLRVINTIYLWYLLANQQQWVESHARSSAAIYGVTSLLGNLMSNATGGLFNVPATGLGQADMLVTFHILRVLLFVSLLIWGTYLYLRFVKGQELTWLAWLPRRGAIEVVRSAFRADALLTVASLFLIVAPFNFFARAGGTPAQIGFAISPVLASLLLGLSASVLVLVTKPQSQWLERLLWGQLLTLIFWNPIAMLKHGSLALGYILYVIGLILVVLVLLKRRGILGGARK